MNLWSVLLIVAVVVIGWWWLQRRLRNFQPGLKDVRADMAKLEALLEPLRGGYELWEAATLESITLTPLHTTRVDERTVQGVFSNHLDQPTLGFVVKTYDGPTPIHLAVVEHSTDSAHLLCHHDRAFIMFSSGSMGRVKPDSSFSINRIEGELTSQGILVRGIPMVQLGRGSERLQLLHTPDSDELRVVQILTAYQLLRRARLVGGPTPKH